MGASLVTIVLGQPANAVCPIINANYPILTGFSCFGLQTVAANTDSLIQEALTNGSRYGKLGAELMAFSIDAFSLSSDTPLYTTHIFPKELVNQSTSGVTSLDSDTMFRLGSLSKLLTVYMYLIKAGDSTWNMPITNFVPELVTIAKKIKQPVTASMKSSGIASRWELLQATWPVLAKLIHSARLWQRSLSRWVGRIGVVTFTRLAVIQV
jgi:hypothetical protein